MKMSRLPGHSLSTEEQDRLIEMYNALGELIDRQGDTLEKATEVLRALKEHFDRLREGRP